MKHQQYPVRPPRTFLRLCRIVVQFRFSDETPRGHLKATNVANKQIKIAKPHSKARFDSNLLLVSSVTYTTSILNLESCDSTLLLPLDLEILHNRHTHITLAVTSGALVVGKLFPPASPHEAATSQTSLIIPQFADHHATYWCNRGVRLVGSNSILPQPKLHVGSRLQSRC